MSQTAADALARPGFGPENLPYASVCVSDSPCALATRLGDHVIDLARLAEVVPPSDAVADAVRCGNLDKVLAGDAELWADLRGWLQATVTDANFAEAVKALAVPEDQVTYCMPFTVADYVDYYASEHHATNLGKMFRPDEAPLKPNWKHLPVGYHGRAGSVVVGGTNIVRPKGLRPEKEGGPSFGPTRRLDIEAEMGFVLGGSAPRGEVSVAQAPEHLFGAFLFNDWSARDIQNFEYVPLGPNLGKSFASSVGPWVVPFAALQDARIEPPARTETIAGYLDDGAEAGGPWGLDITMSVVLDGQVLSNPPFKLMYWTAPQMVAHLYVNGAPLRPGDMFGSGTVSGDEKGQRGSFIELAWGGKEPLELSDGSTMVFLQDGQQVELRATAPGANGSTVDFGSCSGRILPAT